ncbi:MAG: YceI family protein [Bdellovibrionales bacterium]|nr:YceI family protein [Bdellovibrionales bacterium]
MKSTFYCLLLIAGFAQAGTVELTLQTYPVGYFVARSDYLQGTARAQGDTYLVENVRLKVANLRTGISLRDYHLVTNYLEAEKYPEASLRDFVAEQGRFKATLNVHGVDQPVSGTYRVRGFQLEATVNLKISDFKIQSPSFHGASVDDDVRLLVLLPILTKN